MNSWHFYDKNVPDSVILTVFSFRNIAAAPETPQYLERL